jgi:uncharacterized protein (TIRG00374 family)
MAMYLLLTVWSGMDQLAAALAKFPLFSLLPLILVLVLAGWFLRALRWHFFTRHLGWSLPWFPSILAFLASFAFTATPGKVGEAVKAGLLRTRFGLPMTDTMGVLLVERLGDLLAVLFLAVGGLTLLTDAWLYFTVCGIFVLTLTIFISSERLHRSIFQFLARFDRLRPGAEKIQKLLTIAGSLLKPGPFLFGLAIAALSWGCEAFALYLILMGFGMTVPVLTVFSIYGLSTIIGVLSMMPGGVGGVEAAMLFLLSIIGFSAESSVAPVILIRFCTLWFVSFLGFAFMGVWWWTMDRNFREHLDLQDVA